MEDRWYKQGGDESRLRYFLRVGALVVLIAAMAYAAIYHLSRLIDNRSEYRATFTLLVFTAVYVLSYALYTVKPRVAATNPRTNRRPAIRERLMGALHGILTGLAATGLLTWLHYTLGSDTATIVNAIYETPGIIALAGSYFFMVPPSSEGPMSRPTMARQNSPSDRA